MPPYQLQADVVPLLLGIKQKRFCFPGPAPGLDESCVPEFLKETFWVSVPLPHVSHSLAWIHGWSWGRASSPVHSGSRISPAVRVDPGSDVAPCPFPRRRGLILLPPLFTPVNLCSVLGTRKLPVHLPRQMYFWPSISAIKFCLGPGSRRVFSFSSSCFRLLPKGWGTSLQGFMLIL